MSLLKVLTFLAGPLLDFNLAANKRCLHVSGYVASNNEEKEHNVLGVLLVFGHEGKRYGPPRQNVEAAAAAPLRVCPACAHTQVEARAPPANQTYCEITLAAAYVERRFLPILRNANGAHRGITAQCEYLRNVPVPTGSEGMFACTG